MKIGYFLSCEEHPPEELVRQARLADDAGFDGLWISDHFTRGTTSRARVRSCGASSVPSPRPAT